MFDWYRRNLVQSRNYARWIEYSLSSPVMVVLIAMLPGTGDVAAMGAVFGVNATMILFGRLMEHYESSGKPGWLHSFARLRARTTPNVLSLISPHHLSSSLTS